MLDRDPTGLVPHGPARLHPLTLLFTISESIRAFIIPGLLVLFFAWGDRLGRVPVFDDPAFRQSEQVVEC